MTTVNVIHTQFGDCNIIVVDSGHFGFQPVFGTPLTHFGDWDAGDLITFPSSHPNTTITTLPVPEGRLPNYSLQEAVLGCADAFILLLDTCGTDDTRYWCEKLSKCQVPVVCWIERHREEEYIREYKKQTMNRLLGRYQAQTKLELSKEKETTTVERDSYGLCDFFSDHLVMDYNTMVNKIKSSFGEHTPIFSFDPTGLPSYGEESKEKKDLGPVKELFEKTVQECLRLQKERGVNQQVLENKKKRAQIYRPASRWEWGVGNEEDEEKAKKEKKTGDLFSGISKFFNFGSGSNPVKA
eukprot:TRINITY_DN457_c0_g2_i3.p1 TRINITY_DN457_c0_g2~~TRINITY_DN457_c0_g2_i3.p1  ORF type:complete len:297 (+),score=73.54 TRINITY_DN457_c0_g2_i3:86-976(+)